MNKNDEETLAKLKAAVAKAYNNYEGDERYVDRYSVASTPQYKYKQALKALDDFEAELRERPRSAGEWPKPDANGYYSEFTGVKKHELLKKSMSKANCRSVITALQIGEDEWIGSWYYDTHILEYGSYRHSRSNTEKIGQRPRQVSLHAEAVGVHSTLDDVLSAIKDAFNADLEKTYNLLKRFANSDLERRETQREYDILKDFIDTVEFV